MRRRNGRLGRLCFLFYNFNPASIFMGDSGSLSWGSICAADHSFC